MKKILFALLFLSAAELPAQQCNCDSNFVWLKRYMERNYPGYKPKVNDSTRAAFYSYTQKYEELIKKVDNPNYCEYYILKWLQFFKDGHIQLIDNNKNRNLTLTSKDEKNKKLIRKLNEGVETIPIDSIEFVKSLDTMKHKGIQGVYAINTSINNSEYYVAIVKNNNGFRDYAGVILSSKTKFWHKGEVKLELRQISDSAFDVMLYQQNHSIWIYDQPFKILKNGDLDAAPYWKRIIPPPVSGSPVTTTTDENEITHCNANACFTNLNTQTSYLRIHSFSDMFTNEIDSVVKANMNSIKSHKYMIIDLRYNGGGSDDSYTALLPIIYSNPVVSYGVDLYSTPGNILAIKKAEKEDAYLSAEDRKFFDSLTAVMNAHPYQYIIQAPDDTVTSDSIMPEPEKVVVLMNRGCGSTTEQFLLFAHDCKKVTLMGEHSAGVLDYSNIRPVDFPCPYLTLWYPTTRSHRIPIGKGIDGIGIAPKIKLAPDADWIKAAEEYLEKN